MSINSLRKRLSSDKPEVGVCAPSLLAYYKKGIAKFGDDFMLAKLNVQVLDDILDAFASTTIEELQSRQVFIEDHIATLNLVCKIRHNDDIRHKLAPYIVDLLSILYTDYAHELQFDYLTSNYPIH